MDFSSLVLKTSKEAVYTASVGNLLHSGLFPWGKIFLFTSSLNSSDFNVYLLSLVLRPWVCFPNVQSHRQEKAALKFPLKPSILQAEPSPHLKLSLQTNVLQVPQHPDGPLMSFT